MENKQSKYSSDFPYSQKKTYAVTGAVPYGTKVYVSKTVADHNFILPVTIPPDGWFWVPLRSTH